MLKPATPETHLQVAIDALEKGDGFETVLDALPVPVYVTDANGNVTYWNSACVDFAGREPRLGQDRWCVTWALYTTDGEPLPHDKCPMAKAIKEKRPVRNAVAIAVRPNGSRVAFTPYPTPLFDEHGGLAGAVNMLIDISDAQASALSDQASRCRRLSRATNDRFAAQVLKEMASGYEETVAALRARSEA